MVEIIDKILGGLHQVFPIILFCTWRDSSHLVLLQTLTCLGAVFCADRPSIRRYKNHC